MWNPEICLYLFTIENISKTLSIFRIYFNKDRGMSHIAIARIRKVIRHTIIKRVVYWE